MKNLIEVIKAYKTTDEQIFTNIKLAEKQQTKINIKRILRGKLEPRYSSDDVSKFQKILLENIDMVREIIS